MKRIVSLLLVTSSLLGCAQQQLLAVAAKSTPIPEVPATLKNYVPSASPQRSKTYSDAVSRSQTALQNFKGSSSNATAVLNETR